MKNNISTTTNQGAKTLFTDVLKMPINERKAYIKKHSPNMLEAQKRAVLH